MRVSTAQLPGDRVSEDRVVVLDSAVVMLDGASAFAPVPVTPSAYVDELGGFLYENLGRWPGDLRDLLACAIEHAATRLGLCPGESPSSTVAIARQAAGQAEFLVLGDSLVALPGETVIDRRISELGLDASRDYRQRLAAGCGYDAGHYDLLRKLQSQQAEHRNRPGGYWIAEADPRAARHAIVTYRPVTAARWAVLATDGAYKTMDYLGLDDWPSLSTVTSERLADILRRCDSWESIDDPGAIALPRAKRHDDKSLAVVAFTE